MNLPFSKKCFKCGENKELSLFYKHPKMKDGHVNKCKPCNLVDVHANRELRSEYYKAYDRVRTSTPKRKAEKALYDKTASKSDKKRAFNKSYAVNFPNRKKAHKLVDGAIEKGNLIRQPCFVCEEIKVHAHHPDYDRPLDVVWLCAGHHNEVHRQYDRKADLVLLDTTKKGSRYSK